MVWILSFAHCTLSSAIMYDIMKQSWHRSLFLLLLFVAQNPLHMQLMSIPMDINVQNKLPANKFWKLWMCEYFNGIDCIEFETNGLLAMCWKCVRIWKIYVSNSSDFKCENIPSCKIKCIIYFISQRIVHHSFEEIQKIYAHTHMSTQWKESMPIRFVLEWNFCFSYKADVFLFCFDLFEISHRLD